MTQNPADMDAAGRIYGTRVPRRLKPVLAFWDFQVSFPSLAHSWVHRVICRMRLPTAFQDFTKAICTGVTAVSGGTHGSTFSYRILAGLLQGCPLSGLDPFLLMMTSWIDCPCNGVTRACAGNAEAAMTSV